MQTIAAAKVDNTETEEFRFNQVSKGGRPIGRFGGTVEERGRNGSVPFCDGTTNL